ncbi:MAG: DUF1674 domain-containing protein [Granulosicoccus sp.]|nr:DUF1674 domain-containing protein [Granulosicoccus sp.]
MTSSENTPADHTNTPAVRPAANVAASPEDHTHLARNAVAPRDDLPARPARETGGQAGPEPTRYGDWEKKGRCTDF